MLGAPWPKETYCVCKYVEEDGQGSKVLIRKNDPGAAHVEKVILTYLENNGIKPTKMTLYINYSPCNLAGHECCQKILDYKKDHSTCEKIKIIFPKLYKIEEKENIAGLRKLLNEDGIKLKPFQSWENWEALKNVLNEEAQTNKERYTGEINYTETNYKKVEYTRSRAAEDQVQLTNWQRIEQPPSSSSSD